MNQNRGCGTALIWIIVGGFLLWLCQGSPEAKRVLQEVGRTVRQIGRQLEDNGREVPVEGNPPPQRMDGFVQDAPGQ
jgi:hypothetical protein